MTIPSSHESFSEMEQRLIQTLREYIQYVVASRLKDQKDYSYQRPSCSPPFLSYPENEREKTDPMHPICGMAKWASL